jgi:phenylacetate-CoA ligase
MQELSAFQKAKLTGVLANQIYSLFRRLYWSREQIEHYQLAQIRKIIGEARDHVGMYEGRLPKPSDIRSLRDIEDLPILTKDKLLNHSPRERTNRNFLLDNLIVSKSSGSTGRALDVYYDLESYNLFILAGLRLYFLAMPYLPWHKQTYIYTSPYPLSSLFGLYPLNFISTLNPIPDTIEKLKANPPDLLVCYPSHLRSIASQMTPEDFEKIRPKAINVNSEMSTQSERDYLARLFGCFVFDDYSSEELTRIASQCKHLSYHIFEDINYLEITDDKGKILPEGVVGNIVGTNLHNIGMPLIRYAQGDRGSIRSKNCECGRKFRVLESFEGRKNDAFTLSDGQTISSGFLLDLTYGVFLNYPNAVSAFCLVQEKPDDWVLELVPSSKWSPDLAVKIPSELSTNLRNDRVRITPKIVKDVRKTKSGKANPIISDIRK